MADLAGAQGQLDEKQAELDSAQKEYENAINEKQVNKVKFYENWLTPVWSWKVLSFPAYLASGEKKRD